METETAAGLEKKLALRALTIRIEADGRFDAHYHVTDAKSLDNALADIRREYLRSPADHADQTCVP